MTRPQAVLTQMIEELEGQKNVRPPHCRPKIKLSDQDDWTKGPNVKHNPDFRVNDILRRKALSQQIKGLKRELEKGKEKELEANNL